MADRFDQTAMGTGLHDDTQRTGCISSKCTFPGLKKGAVESDCPFWSNRCWRSAHKGNC